MDRVKANPEERHCFTKGCRNIGHHTDGIVLTLYEGFDLGQ
jgi:hypothetical protein